jgi:MarR family transcriptional regulator for hemolysin
MNVTRSQWVTIAVVARRPGVTQREIAEVIEVSEAAAGRVIARLCEDGLLERRPVSSDRRAHAVYVTEMAQPLLERASALAKDREQEIFKGLTLDELQKLNEALDHIRANLGGGPLSRP